MKRFVVRSMPIALITLISLSLLALNIVHLPNQLNPHMRHASEFSGQHTPPMSTYLLAKDLVNSHTSSLYSGWPPFLVRSASLTARSVSPFKLQGTDSASNLGYQETRIGGLWQDILPTLGADSLILPATITFPLPPAAKSEHIPPSSADGYINSRIDLKRRRRAFEPDPGNTKASPSVVLHLREDALFRSRDVDPSTLAGEFEKAVVQGQVTAGVLAARSLRKAKKKKDSKGAGVHRP
jgi:hypothetical protein